MLNANRDVKVLVSFIYDDKKVAKSVRNIETIMNGGSTSISSLNLFSIIFSTM